MKKVTLDIVANIVLSQNFRKYLLEVILNKFSENFETSSDIYTCI